MNLLDIDEAATRIGCSDAHVYSLVAAGKLRRFNISAVPGATKTRVADADVEAFMGLPLSVGTTERVQVLTYAQVGERLGCSRTHVYDLRKKAKKLHGFNMSAAHNGTAIRFTSTEVDAFIAASEEPVPTRIAA